MSINDTRSSRYVARLATHALPMLAGAVAALAILASVTFAPPANADDAWLALAWSPPEGVSGRGIGDEGSANAQAIAACQNHGGTACRVVRSVKNSCVALAVDGANFRGGVGATLDAAKADALAKNGGGSIKEADCAGSQAPAAPAPQPLPKQGPTVAWDPIVGGLVAHITDRSGVTSQCTYTSDFYTRSFPLKANSTFDLKIVPAIPQFRNWNVAINCDNGTSTQTTTFF